jgi:hypothetical protein
MTDCYKSNLTDDALFQRIELYGSSRIVTLPMLAVTGPQKQRLEQARTGDENINYAVNPVRGLLVDSKIIPGLDGSAMMCVIWDDETTPSLVRQDQFALLPRQSS